MNKSNHQHLAIRSIVSDSLLSLLRRAKGLDLLNYHEGLNQEHKEVPADNTEQLSKHMNDGYDFAGFNVNAAEPTIKLTKFVGLFYPVAATEGYGWGQRV